MYRALEDRVEDFTGWQAQAGEPASTFSGVTVALYSHNDHPAMVERAFDGIQLQAFVDNVETVFVDLEAQTEHRVRARGAASMRGGALGSVAQGRDFRAAILNKCIEMASYDHVFLMPAHAVMATNVTLAAAKQQMSVNTLDLPLPVAGVYGVTLPDRNATATERIGAYLMGATNRLRQGPHPEEAGKAGYLDASCSMVSKAAVKGAGGYPPEYGYGGADGELGKRLRQDYIVVEDGTLAVHHTHGFGPVKALRQLLAWRNMNEPRPFDARAWKWHQHLGI